MLNINGSGLIRFHLNLSSSFLQQYNSFCSPFFDLAPVLPCKCSYSPGPKQYCLGRQRQQHSKAPICRIVLPLQQLDLCASLAYSLATTSHRSNHPQHHQHTTLSSSDLTTTGLAERQISKASTFHCTRLPSSWLLYPLPVLTTTTSLVTTRTSSAPMASLTSRT